MRPDYGLGWKKEGKCAETIGAGAPAPPHCCDGGSLLSSMVVLLEAVKSIGEVTQFVPLQWESRATNLKTKVTSLLLSVIKYSEPS